MLLSTNQFYEAYDHVFYVPLGGSGNAGIGAGDQHSFIVPERCQPPAPHDSLTPRPRQCIQWKEVGEIPSSPLRVPGHGPHGYTRRGRDTLQVYNLQRIRNRLPTSSGAPPSANGREATQAPQSIRGYPELLKTIYAIKHLIISLQVTQHLKTLELGKSNKTSRNFTTGYATLKNTWAREKPLPSTGVEPRPVREPARAPRALLNNFYKILRKWFYPYKKITLQNTTN